MLKVHRWFILLGIVFIVFIGLSPKFKEQELEGEFQDWKYQIILELRNKGYNEKTISYFENNARPIDKILYSTDKEEAYYLKVYNKFLLGAQVLLKDNFELFKELEEKYKIPSYYVASIIAINEKRPKESFLNILTSLAYVADFNKHDLEDIANKKNELFVYLKLVEQERVPNNIRGFKDGSFTKLGIIPSMYEEYLAPKEYNIFRTSQDTITWIFSSLKMAGWKYQEPWGEVVIVPERDKVYGRDGFFNTRTVRHWRDLNIMPYEENFKVLNNTLANFFFLKEDGVLVYYNFNILYGFNNNMQHSFNIVALSDELINYVEQLDFKTTYIGTDPIQEREDLNDELEEKVKVPIKIDDLPIDERYKDLAEAK